MDEDEIETHVMPILNEYLEHGDTDEVADLLEDMNMGGLRHQVLVLSVTLAMERRNAQREMTSQLISDLYGRILQEEDMERGFEILLNRLPDLVLDTPTAPTVSKKFHTPIAWHIHVCCIPSDP